MAWTLQPRNYMQAIRPNLYNLAYRRTGVYKGMGWLGQASIDPGVVPGPGMCPGSPGCPGWVSPDQNLATLMEGVQNGQYTIISGDVYNQLLRASASQSTSTTPKWLIPILVGIGAFTLFAGGRRR